MVRFLLLAIFAYGIYWFGVNCDFSVMKTTIIQTFKKEKTINAVSERRVQIQEEVNDIIGE